MKKILLILVGGTICTALNEKGVLSVTERAGVYLKQNFETSDSVYAGRVRIDLTENLFILSENMTVDKWNLMIDTYRKYMQSGEYEGVIFAHGTDTLAYSASLFSMILSDTKVPVFFVSSNERLESSRSNGDANFRCAVECICRGIAPNVYVTYKNLSDGQMYLHLASRIEQCKNYSEDFYSVGALNITDITALNYKDCFDKIENLYPAENRKQYINIFDNWKIRQCVLKIDPYVGINYDAYDFGKFEAVLHGTYHSGTALAEGGNSVLDLIRKCASLNPPVDTYISPSKLSGEIYETVDIIGNYETENGRGINFMYGCTNEMAYCKLLLAYSVFEDEDKRKEFINNECNFEIIA